MVARISKLFSIFSCEVGTLVFATYNLMFWTLGVLVGFGGFVYHYLNGGIGGDSASILLLLVSSEGSLFLLPFAGLLFHGVLKRHAEHIKAYLVLGATVLCLSVVAILFAIPMSFNLYVPIPQVWYWNSGVLVLILLGQVVYTLILAMIYNTYRKIKAENDLSEHYNKITRMSPTRPKRFSLCSSEAGTVFFASLNLIGSALGISGGFVGFFWCHWSYDVCTSKLELVLCSEISLFIMVFAAFLFHGVMQNHPEHIKVYLVMGTVLLYTSNVGLLLFEPSTVVFRRWNTGFLALTVVAQVVYALILAMVYNTYKKIKSTAKDQDQQKIFLVDNLNDNLSSPVHKLLY